jgi:hypothetical protein
MNLKFKFKKELELWATAPIPIANFGRPARVFELPDSRLDPQLLAPCQCSRKNGQHPCESTREEAAALLCLRSFLNQTMAGEERRDHRCARDCAPTVQ